MDRDKNGACRAGQRKLTAYVACRSISVCTCDDYQTNNEAMRRAVHYVFHLADQYKRFGRLINCLTHERKHKSVKAFANKRVCTSEFDRGVLEDCTYEQLENLKLPLLKPDIVEPKSCFACIRRRPASMICFTTTEIIKCTIRKQDAALSHPSPFRSGCSVSSFPCVRSVRFGRSVLYRSLSLAGRQGRRHWHSALARG